jgi:hypothetical protein
MKIFVVAMTVSVLGASLSLKADEEIYKDTDEEGVPVFSDIPTPGSTEVELPPENIADPVTPRPEQEREASEVPSQGAGNGTIPGGVYGAGGNDPLEDIMGAKRREERDVTGGGTPGKGHDLSDAEDRYNPSEADERYTPSDADQSREIGSPVPHRGGGGGRGK